MALKKVGLLTASALCSINLWTGAPLLAIWIGSKVQGSLNNLSMTAVFSVVVVLAGTVSGSPSPAHLAQRQVRRAHREAGGGPPDLALAPQHAR